MPRLLLLLLLLPVFAQADVPNAAWQYRAEMLKSAWRTFGPGAPVATLASQIHQESYWQIDARSWAGAEGLAQFMPMTARDMAERFPNECAPANPFDPRWAFRCRDRYLRGLLNAVGTERMNPCDEWAFGLRSYNGGLTWTRRDQNLAASIGADPNNWLAVMPFNAGRRPSAYKENVEYPVRIFLIEREYAVWGERLGCFGL